MNTIMSIYKSRTHSEQEDFMRELCISHGSLLCAAIRQTGSEKDIFCKPILEELKKRGK
jgi:hypothetical protein